MDSQTKKWKTPMQRRKNEIEKNHSWFFFICPFFSYYNDENERRNRSMGERDGDRERKRE